MNVYRKTKELMQIYPTFQNKNSDIKFPPTIWYCLDYIILIKISYLCAII